MLYWDSFERRKLDVISEGDPFKPRSEITLFITGLESRHPTSSIARYGVKILEVQYSSNLLLGAL